MTTASSPLIVSPATPKQIAKAQQIAMQYQLHYTETPSEHTVRLIIHEQHIDLVSPTHLKPFTLDFTQGKTAHRRQFGGGRGQALAKAIGLKKGATPSVIDCTAGYGQDAFVLASLGCSITLIERHPALAILLDAAINKAKLDPVTSPIAQNMQLIHDDACHYLQYLTPEQYPDVIYLDPMYPSRQKSALVKKEMQLLHQLIGPDMDSQKILAVARKIAKKRIVIKRPKSAQPIDNLPPHSSVESKNTRYDILMTDNQ